MQNAFDEIFSRTTTHSFSSDQVRAYQSASPFPHVVIDNYFDEALLSKVVDEFPGEEDISWSKSHRGTSIKLHTPDETKMGPLTRRLIHELNARPFLQSLSELSGIPNLIPDPYLEGGGLHQITSGGFLKIHADFNIHRSLRLQRRMNLLVYLNKDWKDEYGGHLELWERDMSRCVHKVLPVFNRMVIFSTTDDSFHGHPEPLTCPPEMARKSIALYYYTNGRPSEEESPEHSTIYRERPGESLRSGLVKRAIKACVPPIMYQVRDYLTSSTASER